MKDKIILDNIGLIHKVIKDLHCNCTSQEEYQEYYEVGLIGLITASKKYDEELSKSKYLYIGIKNELTNYFRHKTYKKRYNGLKELSLYEQCQGTETYLVDIIPSNQNLEEEYIRKEEIETINKILNKYKNKKNVEIFKKYYGIGYDAKDLRQLAKEYGVTHQCIHSKVTKLRNKIRKELKNV